MNTATTTPEAVRPSTTDCTTAMVLTTNRIRQAKAVSGNNATVLAIGRQAARSSCQGIVQIGLGIHIAYCQALAMLPAGADLAGHPPVQDDVAQLLHAAEELTRSISVVDETAGMSQLVVAICDLVRETTP